MWLQRCAYGKLFVALLLIQYNVVLTRAAVNVPQLKTKQQQQQNLIQESPATSSAQQQQPSQHALHVRTQTQHHHSIQSQHQAVQPTIAAHPLNNDNRDNILHDSTQTLHTSTAALSYPPPATQYVVNDKDAAMQEVLKHFHADNDLSLKNSYQMFNEFKRDTQVNANHGQPISVVPPAPSNTNTAAYPWNLYDRAYASPPVMPSILSNMFNPFETFSNPYPITPRFLPIMTYPQPVYVPYPLIMPSDLFFPGLSSISNHMPSDYEDSMSRGAEGSRQSTSNEHPSSTHSRNSPIYYVRIPPTPYMYLPGLGLGNPNSALPSYPTVFPYQSLPSFPAFSSVFNVPINFLANGKPTNIYQMSAPPPNEVQNPLQFTNVPSSFNSRPPPPPPPNHYRPQAVASNSYFSSQSPSPSSHYGASHSPSLSSLNLPMQPSHQDSKLTALKRPYYFNGRPEEIYVLPNNFNALYFGENSYY